jgi:hypothetical protein
MEVISYREVMTAGEGGSDITHLGVQTRISFL